MKITIFRRILFFFLIIFFHISIYAKNNYQPEVGDNIILVYNILKNNTLQEAQEFYKIFFISKLKNPKIIKNTLYLENTEAKEIIIITFCRLTKNYSPNLSEDFFDKEIKKNFKSNTITISFRLLTLNTEIYDPKKNDIIIIWEYNYRIKNVEEAIKTFDNDIYPILVEGDYTKNSNLLFNKKLGVYAGITIFTGLQNKIEIVKKRIKKLNKYFWKKSSVKVYRIIKVE